MTKPVNPDIGHYTEKIDLLNQMATITSSRSIQKLKDTALSKNVYQTS